MKLLQPFDTRFLVLAFLLISSFSVAQSRWTSINFGLSNPTGKFRQNDLTVPFAEAIGVKAGWFTSLDGTFYFKEGGKVSVGLSYVVSFASTAVNWEKWVRGSTAFTGESFKRVELKVGIVTTFSLSDNLQLDGFLRIGDNMAWGGAGDWTSGSGSTVTFTSLSADGFGAGYGTNLGVNVRFKRLLGTCQFNTGKVPRSYYLSGSGFSGPNGTSIKIPMTSMNLGIGFLISSK